MQLGAEVVYTSARKKNGLGASVAITNGTSLSTFSISSRCRCEPWALLSYAVSDLIVTNGISVDVRAGAQQLVLSSRP